MTVSKRYAELAGKILVHKPNQDGSYDRFADLQALFDTTSPLYVDRDALNEYELEEE